MKRFLTMMALFGLVAIYLFVSAPQPLPEAGTALGHGEARVPVVALFDAANTLNSLTRKIYTERIVAAGQAAGLKFGENWLEDGVEAGPLPALFLRLVGTQLEAQKSDLALFLGSDQPINRSNAFQGEQVDAFMKIKLSMKPQYFEMMCMQLAVGMYPDVASDQGCVTCHNNHERSPKHDWVLNDIMGAATWTYPRNTVSASEARQRIAEVYRAIEISYDRYLDRVRTFKTPVKIGSEWPAKGQAVIPDEDTFMAAVFAATGPDIARLTLAGM